MLFGVMISHNLHSSEESVKMIKVGSFIPDNEILDINNHTLTLTKTSGKPVLLSFVYIPRNNSKESENSRSQLNFIKSMCTQYSDQGLSVVFVDATSYITGEPTDPDTLINYMYDWHFEASEATLVSDQVNELISLYGVQQIPTTFLIVDGTVLQRWDNIAYSNQLGFSIINALSGNSDTEIYETRAEAKFPGLPMARSLSEQIWMIDGGTSWPENAGYSIKWAVINHDVPCFLRVTATHTSTGEVFSLFEESLQNITREEADVLLSNMPLYENAEIALLDTTVTLTKSGYYTIFAEVIHQKTGETLSSGTAIIHVEDNKN